MKKPVQQSKEKPTKLEITLQWLSLITSICTVIGLFLGIPALNLANEQLKELNAKGEININLDLAKSVSLGYGISDPFDIYFSASNHGDHIPSYWRVAAYFCNDVKVLKADQNWTHGDEKRYFFESEKSLIPGLMIYEPKLDGIGTFKISLSIDRDNNLKDPIPIALVYATGENSKSIPMLISLQSSGAIKEEFKVNDGKVISDIRGCWNPQEDL